MIAFFRRNLWVIGLWALLALCALALAATFLPSTSDWLAPGEIDSDSAALRDMPAASHYGPEAGLIAHRDFDLLADPGNDFLKAAGVGQSDYKGTMYWDRTSFVIDPQGNLRKTYLKVNPDGHERVLLDDIKAMQAGSNN